MEDRTNPPAVVSEDDASVQNTRGDRSSTSTGNTRSSTSSNEVSTINGRPLENSVAEGNSGSAREAQQEDDIPVAHIVGIIASNQVVGGPWAVAVRIYSPNSWIKRKRSDATQSLSFFIFEQEQQKYWFVVEVLGIPNV